MVIEISKSHAEAVMGLMREIKQLQESPVVVRHGALMDAVKLYTDAIVRDLGHDPAAFAAFNIDWRDGKPVMVLTEKPKPEVPADAATR